MRWYWREEGVVYVVWSSPLQSVVCPVCSLQQGLGAAVCTTGVPRHITAHTGLTHACLLPGSHSNESVCLVKFSALQHETELHSFALDIWWPCVAVSETVSHNANPCTGHDHGPAKHFSKASMPQARVARQYISRPLQSVYSVYRHLFTELAITDNS